MIMGEDRVKGKQIAMDEVLGEYDKFKEKMEVQEMIAKINRLDDKYGRMNYRKLMDKGYPKGSVVIIAQNFYRIDGRCRWHFYRTVLNYCRTGADPRTPVFVEATNEEYPERPPWADTVGHEGERKDIGWYPEHIHWATGEIVEPITTWWMKEWGMETSD